MNELSPLAALTPANKPDGIIKLAVMAVGGQGGGVLTDWIQGLARANGYVAQATSVAGVSQRTGATIYYIEMAPAGDRMPVFALLPAAGDVDILIAAEMMEAGRAIIRGFVTPDRTTLIASTHRALAVSEKMVPGDGIVQPDEVRAAAEVAAQRVIWGDFDALAVGAGSVISAALFGALAASGALPFPRAAFEAAVAGGGKGVEASLGAFAAGFEGAGAVPAEAAPAQVPVTTEPAGPPNLVAEWTRLAARVAALPEAVAEMALPGLRKVVGFQDLAYGAAYLARVEGILVRDDAARGHVLTREAAKYIANAMAYDDVIRVADLKTRGDRMGRIAGEMGAGGDRLMQVTEFMHPGAEEIVGLFPGGPRRAGAGRPGLDGPDRAMVRARTAHPDGRADRIRDALSDRGLEALASAHAAPCRRGGASGPLAGRSDGIPAGPL